MSESHKDLQETAKYVCEDITRTLKDFSEKHGGIQFDDDIPATLLAFAAQYTRSIGEIAYQVYSMTDHLGNVPPQPPTSFYQTTAQLTDDQIAMAVKIEEKKRITPVNNELLSIVAADLVNRYPADKLSYANSDDHGVIVGSNSYNTLLKQNYTIKFVEDETEADL